MAESELILPHTDYFIEISQDNTPSHFMLDIFNDIGRYTANGMGIVPISYSEIKAYLDLMGINLDGYYVSILKAMSIAYCRYVQSDENEPHPITGEIITGMTLEKLREIKEY